ncbi:MAG: PspC domain-containing protein [Alistipes indistinctus]
MPYATPIAILGSAKEFGEPIRQTTLDSVGEQQPPSPTVKKRFYRSRYDRMLGGVCGGIARYYDLDPLLVRIITLVLGVFTGLAILPYIILRWIVAPMEPRQITEGTDLKDQ